MNNLAIVHDVISGPALLFGGIVAVVATLVIAMMSETIALIIMRWAPLLRSARDALVVNMASGLLGIVLTVVFLSAITDDASATQIALGSWALSVAVEGALLQWLGGEQPRWKPWACALVMNVVSYGLIFGLGLALNQM